MKVLAIQSAIDHYIGFLQSREADQWQYQFDIIQHLHHHWDLNADDLAQCFNEALDSNVSRRLWHREHFNAKEMMLRFIKMEPDYVKQMFRDLYDETKKVEARIDRFKFYCDELLQMYRHKHPTNIITNHDQDPTIISLYLAGKYPEKYAIYPGTTVFQKILHHVESPQPLLFDDLGRFFKVCQVFNSIGQKKPDLRSLQKKRFGSGDPKILYRQWTGELMQLLDHM